MDVNVPAEYFEGLFLEEVIRESAVDIRACYQCQKCSAGCPVVSAMDISPNQVIRQIQYGKREKVLGCRSIWICASCHTCSVRCPNSIDIAKIMDTLRGISLRSGVVSGEKDISMFHKFFLSLIKYTGRTWEPGFGIYKMKTGGLFGMMGWALKLFLRGKIGIIPTFNGGKDLRRLFGEQGKGGVR
jgi:heterodisulfide reductase subunit C